MSGWVSGTNDEPVVDEALAAAVVAALLRARSAVAGDDEPRLTNRWADRAAAMRPAPRAGTDTWRFSLR